MKKRTKSERGSGSGFIPIWKPCKTLCFVYGTLLSRGRAHSILLALGGRDPQEAILPNHVLFHFAQGDYPLAFPGEGQIKGEVWEIPLEALLILDIYEGVQEGLYERRFLEVSTPTGIKRAWVYRATPQAMKTLKDRVRRVSLDDWLFWRRKTTS